MTFTLPRFWIFGLRWLRIPTRPTREHRAVKLAENCLRPWLVDGDVLFVDDTVSARDGDLVITRMVYESTRSSGLMLCGPPARTTRNAIKQLRVRDGIRYLTCADGSVRAENHEIRGVVVAAWRRQWWKRPKLREMTFAVVE